jgi:SAM-dependent methyltransferase
VTAEAAVACWCGGPLAEAIGPHYRRCAACGSAVRAPKPARAHFAVADDARDFYGRRYWTDYAVARKLPDIASRARSDLSERCLFWLERTLEVANPPGRFLEIGCGHGAFVALMQDLGFDAMGTELSPWVAEFGRRAFGIRVAEGPIEGLGLEPGFRVVAAFDVLEHLEDPLGTVACAGALLAADGVLVLKTPVYRGEGPDWVMFQEDEHIHLFSHAAIRLLLERAGFRDVLVRPSLFPYDMWVVASRQRFPVRPLPRGGANGWRPPVVFDALLALGRRERELEDEARLREADRAARLTRIEALTARLAESEADRAARLEQIEALTARLEQIETLAAKLAESEADRAARLEQIETLTARLAESEADRAARLEQIETLTARVVEAEADRAARLAVIRDLKARIAWIEGTAPWRAYCALLRLLGRRVP